MIKLKIRELYPAFTILKDLLDIDPTQPFSGLTKNLVYDIQREILEYQTKVQELDLTPADVATLEEKEIELGPKLPAPANYAAEQRYLLTKLCHELPEKPTRVTSLFDDYTKEEPTPAPEKKSKPKPKEVTVNSESKK